MRDVGAGVLARFRRSLELDPKKPGERSSRLKVYRGLIQMSFLPSREQFRAEK